jgi:predicted TIM-barrel fold metal-dependent hydrolase
VVSVTIGYWPRPSKSQDWAMTIDMHVHYFPEALVEAMRRRDSAPCIQVTAEGEERRLLPAGNTLPYRATEDTDMEARLAFMDKMSVQRQVLSLGLLFGVHCLPLEEGAPLARIFNDDLSSLCQRYPEQFSGIALLPLADMATATDELSRARSDLGLIGAILPANAFTDLAQAQKVRPLFDAAQRLGAHLFIHPGLRPDEFPPRNTSGKPRFDDNALPRLALQVQANLASAMVTLLFSDFLDPYPNVTVQVANLGGTLPMVIERMDHAAKLRTPDDPLPSSRTDRIYVDCASLGPNAIETAVAVYGANRVVLGTDCPIFRTDWTIDAIRGTRLGSEDRELILSGNAQALLDGIPNRVAQQ